MPHGDAERQPRKLDEREHGVCMTEEGRNFNSQQNLKMNRRSDQSSRVCQDGRVKGEEVFEERPLTCGIRNSDCPTSDTYPHKKPQGLPVMKMPEAGMVCPVLVATR
jgi:hypothetical protein